MSHKKTCENNRRLRKLYDKTKYNYAAVFTMMSANIATKSLMFITKN